MKADPRLQRLTHVATLLADRALEPVAAKQFEVDEIRQKLTDLSAKKADILMQEVALEEGAILSRHLTHIGHERSRLLLAQAKAEAALEIAKDAARLAVGRREALTRLLGRP